LYRDIGKSLEAQSGKISRLEKSRNFWRIFALAGIPAAAGAGLLAGMLVRR
jgi:hypothetical protein